MKHGPKAEKEGIRDAHIPAYLVTHHAVVLHSGVEEAVPMIKRALRRLRTKVAVRLMIAALRLDRNGIMPLITHEYNHFLWELWLVRRVR